MASMSLFFLLATLAVAAAASDYGVNNQPTYPMPPTEPKQGETPTYPMPPTEPKQGGTTTYPATSPSCRDNCNKDATEQLREARKQCCREVSKHLECLCPTMNTLIAAGVPLKEVCYDDMACMTYQQDIKNNPLYKVVDTDKKCTLPEGVCKGFVETLNKQKKNGCIKAADDSSPESCFLRSLSEVLGADNAAKLIQKLTHP